MHSSSTEWKTLRATTLSLALALAGGSALLAAPAPAQSPASAVPAATMVRGLPDFTELVEQVGPSVVNIRTLEKTSGRVAPAGLDAFLYTERGVYRSGETVFLTALLRDSRGQAITAAQMADFIVTLSIPAEARERLKALTPGRYVGKAVELARRISG